MLPSFLASERTGVEVELAEDKLVDPTLDILSSLEGNSLWVRNILSHSRQAFIRFYGHFFPQKPLTDDVDFLELVKIFSSDPDPVPEFRHTATKAGVEVAMAMAHGELTNWEKVSSSYAKDDVGKAKSLKPFIKEVKKYSKTFLATTQPSKGYSSALPFPSTTHTEVP
jgi:hypothetical protein